MKYLFYSDKSKACMMINNLAPANELTEIFRSNAILFVNIHNPGIYQTLRGKIQYVPSLIFETADEIRVVEGKSLIAYLSALVMKYKKQHPPPAAPSQVETTSDYSTTENNQRMLAQDEIKAKMEQDDAFKSDPPSHVQVPQSRSEPSKILDNPEFAKQDPPTASDPKMGGSSTMTEMNPMTTFVESASRSDKKDFESSSDAIKIEPPLNIPKLAQADPEEFRRLA